MNSRFIQIHALTSYPAALLNRDDVGFAKRVPFGGATRTRISSQCLKRHWRTYRGDQSLESIPGIDLAIRSRLTFERHVYQPLVESGVAEAAARAATAAVMEAFLQQSAKASAKKSDADGEGANLRTGQVTVLGRPEVQFMLSEARTLCEEAGGDPAQIAKAGKARFTKEAAKNLRALAKSSWGLDAAMFGRFITSDILARSDAAVHVAHAFTVHAEEAESDYFSAVDDLATGSEEGAGSGHIGSTELTSGLYYLYVVVDVPLLVSNLEGSTPGDWREADRTVAAEAVGRLTQMIATVSPGAKLGSTAPHSYALMVMVESGASQPRTLANAFLQPVQLGTDPFGSALTALGKHVEDMDAMYGRTAERALCAPPSRLDSLAALSAATTGSISDVASWAASQVKSD